MLKDLKFFRRNNGKKNDSSNEEIENVPVNPSSDSFMGKQVGNDVTRAPLNIIQEPFQIPKSVIEQDLSGRNRFDKTPTKKSGNASVSGLRTPDKQGGGFSSRNKFGWVQKNEGGEMRDEGKNDVICMSRGLTNMTPRSVRSVGRNVNSYTECSSTQSTPTKSVTKPPNPGVASLSSARPPVSYGARAANFAALTKGVSVNCAPPMVVNTVEVPYFEMREDPSFWMDHNVQVLIRVRPLNSMERNSQGYSRCLKQESAQSIAWIGQLETRFTFDHVACETVNQDMLFRVAGLPMVENCLSGYNSCMFAYGQTGSGKTYTMLGEIDELEVKPSLDRGMTPRIFEFLFARIRAEEESRRDEKLKYNCKCSFLEIYNEQITDLLDPSSTNLLLREDNKKGVYVENLTEYEVQTVNDILKLLTEGAANRKVAVTNMNRESSRSHSVFTCVIESRWEKESTTNLRFARLNLVDLAGSERQKTSGAEGERLKEAANINKSLSTLGHVIMMLVDVAHGKLRHIPYRDSRLTFLLQESLGGNSKTMIIANVSPSICCAAETLSTLKFAQRAKLIQNNVQLLQLPHNWLRYCDHRLFFLADILCLKSKAVINEDASGDVRALQHQIHLLKEELSLLRHRNVSRSLSFRSASLRDTDEEGHDVSSEEITEMAHDSADDGCHQSPSFGIVRMSTKQLKSLEATLAGALRREKMADSSIKQLEAEIEQLNRLVHQREEDTRCSKMMLRFREDKIQRMESLLDGSMPSDAYLLEENNVLSEELQLLRAKVDRNPEVTRFALENIRLLDKLRRFQDFYEEGEREMLLAEVSELRDQMLQSLDGNKEQSKHLNVNMPYQLRQTHEELEQCRNNLNSCLEINNNLSREINDLQCQLNVLKSVHQDQHFDDELLLESLPEVQAFETHLHEAVQKEKAKWKHEAIMKHTEEIMNLQLELDILKIILQEERSSRGEVEEKAASLSADLEMAKERCLQISMHCEDVEDKLNNSRSVIEALESQELLLINELDGLRENNNQFLELLGKQEQETSGLREQFSCQELRDLPSLEHSESKDTTLQVKLTRMLGKQEQETSGLREQFSRQELRDLPSLEHSESKDTTLQVKLMRMQDSLEKAKRMNLWYQSDQASLASHEQEADDVRRQVEAETADVIICLQEELTVLQQQVKDSSGKQIETKESLLHFESELKDLKERLCLTTQDNDRLNELVLEKNEELRTVTEEWERFACEIEEVITDGYGAIEDASDQVDLISSSFPPRTWIREQVGRILRNISEKELLIEELRISLEEAQSIRIDMDWKLRSLRGAALAITEVQQQENSEKEEDILLLTSQLSEKSSVIAGLEKKLEIRGDQVARAETCSTVAFVIVNRLSEIASDYLDVLKNKDTQLNESISLNLKKEALYQDQVAATDGVERQIQGLRSELEGSEESCILLKQKLSEREEHVHRLERKLEDVEKDILLKTREKLDEFKLGVSTLNMCINEYSEEVGIAERVQTPGKKVPKCADVHSEGRIEVETSEDINRIESHVIGEVTSGITECSLKVSKAVHGSPLEQDYLLSGNTSKVVYDRDLTILLLRKEIESALESLKGVQSQMVKLLEEKEEISNSEKQSKRSMECFISQLLALQAEICGSEERLKLKTLELEQKLQKLENSAEEARFSWLQKEEEVDLDLNDAKEVAMQKTTETASLLAKFEEAQETMKDAEVMVNALVIANDTSKLEVERLKEVEVKLTKERDILTDEVQTLRFSNHQKDQLNADLEKQFLSDLSDTRSLVMALEDVVTDVQTVFKEDFESLFCDFQCFKSQIVQSTNLTRSWLEDIWSEMILKDCAMSVLHLCHMGVLLEAVNGLNAENGLLHHGLCESNSIVADLKEHNIKARRELEMCRVLKGKLLVDIKNSYDRILRKEDEAGRLSAKLSSFEKKILDLQFQEELMLDRSDSMGSELSLLMKELDLHNSNALEAFSAQEKLLRDNQELTKSQFESLTTELISKDFESLIFASELLQMGHERAGLVSKEENLIAFLEYVKKELISLMVEADLEKQLFMDTEAEVSLLKKVVQETDTHRNDLSEKLKQCTVRLLEVEQEKHALEHDIEDKVTKEISLKASICKLQTELDQKEAKVLEICSIEEVNGTLKDEVRMLKADYDKVFDDLEKKKSEFEDSCSRIHCFDQENQRLQEKNCYLEDGIAVLRTDRDLRNEESKDLRNSQTVMAEELNAKGQDLEIQTILISSLKEENNSLKSKFMSVKQNSEVLLSLVSSHVKSCADSVQAIDSTQNRMLQVVDGGNTSLVEKMFDEICENKQRASNFIMECECLERHIEELTSANLSLQVELLRKDDVLKGLLFDLSLLQESASNTKDQKDEVEEMMATVESLGDDLAQRSFELDEAVTHSQMLESQLQEKLNLISSLEFDLSNKCESLKLVMDENAELKSKLEDISLLKGSAKEELKEKDKVMERLEEEIFLMDNSLGQMNGFLEGLKNDLNEVTFERNRLNSEVGILKENLEMTQAFAEEKEALAVEAQQIAESRKTYAEDKEEEVKLLERSVEELESTVDVLENKVDIVKGEAERQRLLREELETELQVIRNQMLTVTTGTSLDVEARDIIRRHPVLQSLLEEKDRELQKMEVQIEVLEKNIAEKNAESFCYYTSTAPMKFWFLLFFCLQISQCRVHISELNLHAEAQAHEYKQKFKALEAMAEQVKPDHMASHIANATSTKQEKNAAKTRGSGSPFKCIGLGLTQQINSEKNEELTARRLRIEELEAEVVSQKKEVFMLHARLAAAESMTHDVIRDLLGVKLDMTNYASLLDNQQVQKITKKAQVYSESPVKEQGFIQLKQQLNEFIEERQGWLEEINRRHVEMVAAQVASEKLRQRDQFLTTENEILKKEIAGHKKKVMELEDEVTKLSGQQNLQQRIHHHAKIKAGNLQTSFNILTLWFRYSKCQMSIWQTEENNLLKIQNEGLSIKVRRMEMVLPRLREELVCFRASNGMILSSDFDEELRLNNKLKESEEEKLQLAQKLLSLSTSILKAAGITRPAADASIPRAEEALDQLKDQIVSLERELQDLKFKNKIYSERLRLSELKQRSSPLSSRVGDNCTTPERVLQTPFLTDFDR
ncbi:hypothetical protein IFM89_011128 [Coptis chinensis]|uniref:Kinesin motor domain-containing protein n=1 Tax=Coptis chinensis TaxID=261450 RepID=A0A835HJG7_9MAGN|nr:hypothetical protein IFM89_011128 [Coptis chinensis]